MLYMGEKDLKMLYMRGGNVKFKNKNVSVGPIGYRAKFYNTIWRGMSVQRMMMRWSVVWGIVMVCWFVGYTGAAWWRVCL